MSANQQLFKKYNVTKANGKPTDPNAEYFILRIDTDPAARVALLTYAHEMFDKGEDDFCEQLCKWVVPHASDDELLDLEALTWYRFNHGYPDDDDDTTLLFSFAFTLYYDAIVPEIKKRKLTNQTIPTK